MVTCKDCVHFNVCNKMHRREFWDEQLTKATCKNFVDESKIKEFPCNVGDTVYVIPTIENRLDEIIEMKCISIYISDLSNNITLVDKKYKMYQPSFERFGVSVFLTSEEAEQKLKNLSKE